MGEKDLFGEHFVRYITELYRPDSMLNVSKNEFMMGNLPNRHYEYGFSISDNMYFSYEENIIEDKVENSVSG